MALTGIETLLDPLGQPRQGRTHTGGMRQGAQLFEEQNGVSMDEQMMQLTRIQNAYMASAKLVGVVERMLDTLQNL